MALRSADKKREWGKPNLQAVWNRYHLKTKQNQTNERKGLGFWGVFFSFSNVGAFNTQSASHTTALFYYKVDQNRQINQVRTVSALCLRAISCTYLS